MTLQEKYSKYHSDKTAAYCKNLNSLDDELESLSTFIADCLEKSLDKIIINDLSQSTVTKPNDIYEDFFKLEIRNKVWAKLFLFIKSENESGISNSHSIDIPSMPPIDFIEKKLLPKIASILETRGISMESSKLPGLYIHRCYVKFN